MTLSFFHWQSTVECSYEVSDRISCYHAKQVSGCGFLGFDVVSSILFYKVLFAKFGSLAEI
jgi:hypothetical protein